VDQHPELMADQVLMVPDFSKLNRSGDSSESDGLLEI
jgi:hypothetical protein